MVRPMLGDLDLEQVQVVETDEDQVVTHHPVASLDGGFVQPIGRRAARFHLAGVLTAAPTLDSLAQLRTRFMNAQPVPFVSDISSATLVDTVLIEEMNVREMAGAPERLEYRFILREYAEPEPIEPGEVVVPPTPIPEVEHGSLAVTVLVEGDPDFDFDRVGVFVEGTPDEGPPMTRRQLTNRTADNVWFEEEFPAGSYRIDAIVDDNRTPTGERETLNGSAETRVENGEVAEVLIVLRRGSKMGNVFIVHFRFDSAFVEPCMLAVLRQVADWASAHTAERLLIVGHTDKVGSDAYNQSLSERRGRSVYAAMTFGIDRQRSIDEWNELRRARPIGVLPAARDTWGSREYQQMLQHIGYYTGAIGGDADLTDAAVRRFQTDNGLSVDGDVGDQTWPVLIDQYLARDPLAISAARFLPNADESGCDEGPLRWLGCNEQDPVLNVEHAWRPNRRTELMFVQESAMPCPVPEPETLDLNPAGAGGGGWCLDDGTASTVCCFVTPADAACPAQETTKWCRKPAEPGTFRVSGRLQFSDGSPLANHKYVLIAPDGEYLDGEVKVTSGAARAGTPIQGRTDADGRFSYDRETGTGIYTLEVDGPFVVHLEGEPVSEAKGPVVCARLDGSRELIAVVVDRAVAGVTPSLTGPTAVVVDRPHTNPARQPVALGATPAFSGTGTLTRSSDAVRFFDAPVAGNEITFDGVDNVFTSAQLAAGHQLFAQGSRASVAVDDVTLTLALTVNGTPGLTTAIQMTSVLLTLDVHMSRTSTTSPPAPIPDADKVATGRFVHVQDTGNHAGRAMLTVRQATPAAFAGNLVLQALDARVRIFGAADEVAGAGQVPVATPMTVGNATIPAAGLVFWAEGVTVSGALRDTGFQLGIENVEPDGDRVALTVVQFSNLTATIPSTPAQTARLGNSPVPNHTFTVGAAPTASDFDEDFTVNVPLPLVENSVVAAAPIQLAVQVAPAGTPVSWSAQRGTGLSAASGGDDHPTIVGFHAAATPTVSQDPANPLQATLLTDNVGSFHVRPFVDGNGNGTFEHRIDREPFIIMNVVLARVTLHRDNSIARNGNFTVTALPGNGINVDSGSFDVDNPATAAMHLNAQVDVVTGGSDGRRIEDQYFGGWCNNVTGPNVSTATYTDSTVVPPTVHPVPRIFASNSPAGGVFAPGGTPPALIAPPILDSGRVPAGSGGDSAMLGRSRIRTRTDRPVGRRWIVEAVDSPALGATGAHPAQANPNLTAYAFTPAFVAFLTVWTNTARSSAPTGDPTDRMYSVVRQVTWSQNGRWTIDPATGSITEVAAPTTNVSAATTNSPSIRAAATPVEVRPPAAVPSLALDGRA